MLKDILRFRKRRLFVEKLFVLQQGQEAVEVIFRLRRPPAAPGSRETRGQSLRVAAASAFSSGARRSMRAARTPCTVVGMMQTQLVGWVSEPAPTRASRTNTPCSNQLLDNLFHEERRAFGLVEDELFESLVEAHRLCARFLRPTRRSVPTEIPSSASRNSSASVFAKGR